MDKRVSGRLFFAIAAGTLLVAIIGLYLNMQLQSQRAMNAEQKIFSSYQVITRAEVIFRMISDEVLTLAKTIQKPDFKGPSIELRKQIYSHYDEMRLLVLHHPELSERLDPLRKKALERLRLTDSIHRLFVSDSIAARALLRENDGTESLDSLRLYLDNFRAGESKAIAKLQETHRKTERITSITNPIFFAVSAIVAALLLFIVIRYIQQSTAVAIQNKHNSFILQNIFEAVIKTDQYGKIILWNKRAEDLLGWTSEEACKKEVQGLLQLGKPERDRIARALTWTSHFEGELNLPTKEGGPLLCLVSTSVIYKKAREIAGTVTILRDVSKRKERYSAQGAEQNDSQDEILEQQLEESQEMNRKLNNINLNLLKVREDERLVLSSKLHDHLGNDLASARMNLAMILEELDLKDEALEQRFRNSIQTITNVCHSITQISTELKPKSLQDLGMFTALEIKVSEFTKRTQIPVTLRHDTDEILLEDDETLEIFRIVEQVLNYAEVNPGIRKVNITTLFQDDSFIVTIHLNGGVMSLSLAQYKADLQGINDKAKKIGALSSFRQHQAGGIEINVILPVGEQLSDQE